jgi:hypothetical protein
VIRTYLAIHKEGLYRIIQEGLVVKISTILKYEVHKISIKKLEIPEEAIHW